MAASARPVFRRLASREALWARTYAGEDHFVFPCSEDWAMSPLTGIRMEGVSELVVRTVMMPKW